MPEHVHTIFSNDESCVRNHSLPLESGREDLPGVGPGYVADLSRKRKRPPAVEACVPPATDRGGRGVNKALKLSRNTERPKLVDFVDGGYDESSRGGREALAESPLLPSSATQRGQLKMQAQELLSSRQMLPITPHADEVRSKLRTHDVLLLVGETGSGKSTQIPQFLVDEPWCKKRAVSLPSNLRECDHTRKTALYPNINIKVGGCIAITQPRRLAAISLASRVAAELGTPLGSSSPASQVGYSVRFNNSVSPCTRIKFLTEGMLLQEMLQDPSLRKYSAVIVDEVHERSVNVDLVLAFLKKMMTEKDGLASRGGIGIKVVVMSATADMQGIKYFFSQSGSKDPDAYVHGGQTCTNGANNSTSQGKHDEKDGYDSESSWSGLSSSSSQLRSARSSVTSSSPLTDGADVGQTDPQVTSCFIRGRQYPVKTIYTPSPVQDILDSALQTILHIHTHEALPGDILVFLTGQEAVENLVSLCQEAYRSSSHGPKDRLTVPKLMVLPLFAALPHNAQQRVFGRTPARTRKVIISTNIAETSLTVPGIRYVVDSGKCKKKQFRSRLGLDSLLVKPISASAANQRKGRAGREAAGTCYRLYTEKDYLTLDQDNDPEILRCDLGQLVLNLKARGVDDVANFSLLTPPPRDALERALLHLLQLQALDQQTGRITPAGRSIAQMPLTPSLGRVLLSAASRHGNCVAECIDIVAALSVENIFLTTVTEEKKEAAELARRDLYRREGDHLTYLAAVQAYAAEPTDRKAWCEQRLISHRAMQSVMDVRKQLLAQSYLNNSTSPPTTTTATTLQDQDQNPSTSPLPLPSRILKTFLTGFISNTARLMPDGGYRTVATNQAVAIHPSSVLFGRRCEAIMYNDFVFTQRSYARAVSAVQLDWVGEVVG